MTDYEHRLTVVEDRSKANEHRIEDIEKRQDDQEKLISTVAVLASEQKTIKDDVNEIKGDVKNLANKPGKRWEKLVETAITVVVSALVGFILAKYGM